MQFLNPAALYALSLLPLLVIPYLIRRRPRRILFSSLILLRELSPQPAGRRWRRLRLPLLFFLQLLFALSLVLALGEPILTARPSQHLALVFDNSASMQTREGQRSRSAMAKDAARELLRRLSAGTRVDLFVSVPRLEPTEESLSPAEALRAIDGLASYDMGDQQRDVGAVLSRLREDRGYDRVYFFTDRPAQGQDGAVSVVSVGQPQANLAITSFRVTRSAFASSRFEARVEVTNFSPEEKRVDVFLRGGGNVVSSETLEVPSRGSAVAHFAGLPSRPSYEAELDAGDPLALDNRRHAVPPASAEMAILGISPRPRALHSLSSIPGLTLKVISPEAYPGSAGNGQPLEIFHYSAPDVLPRRDALLVLPPQSNPLVGLQESLSQPLISGWREPHPLTRYVNFSLFRSRYARPLKPLSAGEPIVESPEGPLAVVIERQGFRYLVLGFDPFPYLGRANLPVSVFTLNVLQWFYRGTDPSGIRTGEPLRLDDRPEGGTLVTPKEEEFRIEAKAGPFPYTFYQGIYRFGRGLEPRLIAVNFDDARESDLANPVPVSLKRETEAARSRPAFTFWPYLLLLSMLFLLLEWFMSLPAARPVDGSDRGVSRRGP